MDSQDPRSAVSGVLNIVRRATRTVQIAPFAYLVFYIAYLVFGVFLPDNCLTIFDSIMTIHPLTTAGLLCGSRLFKLCGWHKTACLIPMSSQVENYIDSFVLTFTQNEIILINVSLGILSVVFLVLAIKHFVYGR